MKLKKVILFGLLLLSLVVSVMSLPMMAFAADDGIYYPADYEVGTPQADPTTGIITYTYEFGVTPRINTYFDGVYFSSEVTDSTLKFYPPLDTTKVTFRTYPLGVFASSNSPWPADRGVVDVRDFKAYSQFTLSATYDISLAYIALSSGVFDLRSYWNVYCYDSNGWYTGTIQSEVTSVKYDVGDSWTSGTTYTAGGTIQLPEGTSYILPACNNTIYCPTLTSQSRFEITVRDLKMEFSIDSVLENTLTMQVIKEQLKDISDGIQDTNDKLDDLNGKTDETNDLLGDIIDGDYQDKEDVEHNLQDSESVVDDINSAVGLLESYQTQLPSGNHDAVNSFLKSRPWQLVGQLVSPIMEWNQVGVIMLLVVGLINLSIILFGR